MLQDNTTGRNHDMSTNLKNPPDKFFGVEKEVMITMKGLFKSPT
jgi:hypothetical protein